MIAPCCTRQTFKEKHIEIGCQTRIRLSTNMRAYLRPTFYERRVAQSASGELMMETRNLDFGVHCKGFLVASKYLKEYNLSESSRVR